MDFLTTKRLYVVNNCLTVVITLLGLYILAAPFAPQISWWVRHDSPVHRIIPGTPNVTIPVAAPDGAPNPELMQGDQLIIPALDMREQVHEGDIRALRKGIWRIPHTSTPDKGGNTVLAGHRFTYAGKAVLYHLDKVRPGDRLALTWQGKLYEYEISTIKVVPPTEVSIEANTTEPQLTIYTCTPLLTAKDRLVIQAKLVEAQE